MKAEKHTKAKAPGNGFPHSTAVDLPRRKEKVIITDNMNCINPSHPIPSAETQQQESGVFTKRIGSTNYRVSVHFSNTSRETMNEKILRLIKGSREIEDFVGRGGATEQSGFPPQGGSNGAKSATTSEAAKP